MWKGRRSRSVRLMCCRSAGYGTLGSVRAVDLSRMSGSAMMRFEQAENRLLMYVQVLAYQNGFNNVLCFRNTMLQIVFSGIFSAV